MFGVSVQLEALAQQIADMQREKSQLESELKHAHGTIDEIRRQQAADAAVSQHTIDEIKKQLTQSQTELQQSRASEAAVQSKLSEVTRLVTALASTVGIETLSSTDGGMDATSLENQTSLFSGLMVRASASPSNASFSIDDDPNDL